MTVGDVVKIYQKPLTREDYEGEARVVRIIKKEREGDGLVYRAMVNFPEDGDGRAVERTVTEGKVVA